MSEDTKPKSAAQPSANTGDAAVKRDSQPSANAVRDREDRDSAYEIEKKLAILRDGMENDILPTIKNGDPNMHYMWLSTTNQTDAIHKRLRLGYELVHFSELPEFQGDFRVNTGQFEGCIAVNEMILAKIHKRLYQEIMLINHHEKPEREEQNIQNNAVKPVEDRKGKQLGGFDVEDQGFKQIVDHRRTPNFN
jgi:hypothetical protein